MPPTNHSNIGRRIVSPHDLDGNANQPSTSTVSGSSSAPTAPIDPPSDHLYITNALNSFSFGNPQQPRARSHSASRSLNPLSPSADDLDDGPLAIADVTPRPSVAYPPEHVPPRSHPSQPPGDPPNLDFLSNPAYLGPRLYRPYQDDAASHHTFGFSSASASVTSFSSRDGSHPTSSRQASSTDNQISTTDDSDSEDDDHRHPIPHHSVITTPDQRHQSSYNNNVEFSSDDDYEDSELDDYTDEEDVGMDIEISSAQFENPDFVPHSQEFDRILYGSSGSHSSIRAAIMGERRGSVSTLGTMERRGSLPMAIPGAPSGDAQDPNYGYGSRDANIATLRRGSKSLDQDRLHSILERPLPPAPVSYPESEGDWRNLEEKHKGKGKARQGDPSSSSASFVAGDPLTFTSMQGGLSSNAPKNPVMDGFDMNWEELSKGIWTIDTAEVADIISNPSGTIPGVMVSDANQSRRPSATKWISKFINHPANNRRPSTATTASLAAGDSFGRAIGKWGGDEYRTQRRDWTFKRERADRPGGVDPSELDSSRLSTEVPRTASAMRRTSLGGFLTPSQSIMTEKSLGAQDYVDSLRALSEKEKEREREREREREEKERERRAKGIIWRGMSLNSQEVWRNDLVGRYKVDRKATKPADPSKGPQQRLNVTHFRDPFITPLPGNGPPVTIHKHSKAIAFSISRHYHLRAAPPVPSSISRGGGAAGSVSRTGRRPGSSDMPANNKKRASMILLAPRRVQEAFTSTTTTRKLEDHGLLNMLGVTQEQANAVQNRRHHSHQRPDRDRDRGRATSKDRREKGKGKEREKDRERERERERSRIGALALSQSGVKRKGKQPETGQSSSTGSIVGSSSTTVVASSSTSSFPSGNALAGSSSNTSPHVYPPAPNPRPYPAPPASAPMQLTLSSSSSSTAAETSSSSAQHNDSSGPDYSLYRPSSRTRRRRRGGNPYDSLDDDEDSDGPPHTRTPHSETYGTMDPVSLEQLRANDRTHNDPDNAFSNKIVALFRGKTGHASSPAPPNAHLEAHYEPPWLVLASRNKQEQQQRVVDNLNSSFKDVGLLPSTHKDRSKTTKRKIKGDGRQASTVPGASGSYGQVVDIFEEVPGDSLYMLLPLWPGDTDPPHERKLPLGYVRPHIASEDRQYLLVYYVAQNETEEPRIDHGHESAGGKGYKESANGGKKRGKDSPTNSHEVASKRDKDKDRKDRDRDNERGHGHRRGDDRSILLPSFHVSARLVSYRDLQGSGVRVPDEGLTVTGPLDTAFNEMPQAIRERNRDKEMGTSLLTPNLSALSATSSPLLGYASSSSSNVGTISAPAVSLSSASSPALTSRVVEKMDYVVGVCHSRDAGIEFFPEGLVKMGLCIVTPPSPEIIAAAHAAAQADMELALGGMGMGSGMGPTGPMGGMGGMGGIGEAVNSAPPSAPEVFIPPEPSVTLTQIGRAVIEMAWLGGMALTSFGPGV